MRYTNQEEMDYEKYLKDNLQDRANDKFMSLPDFYTKPSDPYQYANIQDVADSITQAEWIAIARLLRDGNPAEAGIMLNDCLKRVCTQNAEDELEQEWDDGKPQIDALADRADYEFQRMRDDALEKEMDK